MKLVISGFPGVGKTYLYNSIKAKGIKVSDSDSSLYKGQFPLEYLDHIEDLVHDSDVDVILVSSHEEVRKGLQDRGIKYILVYPDINSKNQYIERYIDRGSSIEFITLLSNKWEEWITTIENSSELKYKLEENVFGKSLPLEYCYDEIINLFLDYYVEDYYNEDRERQDGCDEDSWQDSNEEWEYGCDEKGDIEWEVNDDPTEYLINLKDQVENVTQIIYNLTSIIQPSNEIKFKRKLLEEILKENNPDLLSKVVSAINE